MINPKKYCVLVHRSDSLINHAILSLTDLEQSIEVVVSEANDINELAAEISEFTPVVVLFYESQPMATKEALTQLLTCHPKIRIVIVSVHSNWLYVFNKEDLLLTKLEDLLTVIKAE